MSASRSSLFLIAVAVVRTCYAQESVTYASISGRVTDPSRAVVQSASVTARHTQTNIKSSGLTDSDGRFRFPYLRVGPYVVTVSHAGFTEFKRSLVLSVGSAYELPIALSVAA